MTETTPAEQRLNPDIEADKISSAYTDVAMITHPGFDEISAKVLLERFLNAELGVHSFANFLNLPDTEIDDLEAAGIFAIDLGRNQYKVRKCRSATEVVAKEYSVELTGSEAELVDLANQDNESGLLNKYVDAMSTPWALRKLYEIQAYGSSPEDVVARMSHVIYTWLRYKDGEQDLSRETDGLYTEFPDLIEKFRLARPKGDFAFNHFTTLRYLRDMWRIGIPVEEIRERTEYWITAHQEVRSAIAEGERQLASLTPTSLRIGQLSGLVLESGDPFINRAALCKCDIIVAKDSLTGHALIATHGLNTGRLARALARQEPEKWFEVRGWIVNGGLRNRGTRATRLTTGELVEMVGKFPPQPPVANRTMAVKGKK